MSVRMMETGPLAVCCYIVSADSADGGGECVVIDPGGNADAITATVKRLDLKIAAVFLTHSHGDHIGGVDELLAQWPGAGLWCSAETSRRVQDPKLNLSVFMGTPIATRPADRILKGGEEFSVAGLQWRAVDISGHDPGELVYVLGDGHEVFTGDTLFSGSIGRSDFPGSDGEALVNGVIALLKSLPADGTIYPGHGPATKVGVEMKHNPFLQGGF